MVTVHKRHYFPLDTYHSSQGSLFQEYTAISVACLMKFLLKIQSKSSKIQLRANFMKSLVF